MSKPRAAARARTQAGTVQWMATISPALYDKIEHDRQNHSRPMTRAEWLELMLARIEALEIANRVLWRRAEK